MVPLFADDTKMYKHISDNSDSSIIQADLGCLLNGSEKMSDSNTAGG